MIQDKFNIKAFVASSSDVAEERELLPKIFNKIIKSHVGISLEPVLWEYDIDKGTYPGYHSIQDYINPNLEVCDFCIFIFFSRLGKYTLEEFELAKKLQKKSLVFFKNGFLKPEHKSHIELLSFKNNIRNECLFIEYNDTIDFEAKITDQLHLVISKHYKPIATAEFNKSRESVNMLIRLLTDKENEIEELKEAKVELIENKIHINNLELEIQNLKNQLLENVELEKEHTKDLKELQELRNENIANNDLKNQAYLAIDERDFKAAKELLLTATSDAINSTAQTFYEISKVSKLELNFLESYSYLCTALEMDPNNSVYLKEATLLSEAIGYYTNCIVHYVDLCDLEETTEVDKIYYCYKLSSLYLLIDDIEFAEKFLNYIYNYLSENIEGNHEFAIHAFNNIATLYFKKDKYNLAIEWYNDALQIAQAFFEETNIYIGITLDKISVVYAEMGDTNKAIEYSEKALNILNLHLEESEIQITTSLANIGQLYMREGKYIDAVNYIMKAYMLDKINLGEDHPRIASHYHNIAELHFQLENYNDSKEYFEKSLEMDADIYGKNHPKVVHNYKGLAASCRQLGELNDSLFYIKKAIEIQQLNHDSGHLLLASCYYELGKINLKLKDKVNAIINFQNAIKIISENIGSEYPDIKIIEEEIQRVQNNEFTVKSDNFIFAIFKNLLKKN